MRTAAYVLIRHSPLSVTSSNDARCWFLDSRSSPAGSISYPDRHDLLVVLQDGTSNWLKGALLMVTYIFVAAGFWVHKDGLLQLNIDNSD